MLRWGENLRDRVAAFRVLQLLPGIGPGSAQRAADALAEWAFSIDAFARHTPPAAARSDWPALCELLARLRGDAAWLAQLGLVRRWYQPHLERIYDHAQVRAQDLDQLEQIAAHYPSPRALPLGADARSAAGDRRSGGPASARRGLS